MRYTGYQFQSAKGVITSDYESHSSPFELFAASQFKRCNRNGFKNHISILI